MVEYDASESSDDLAACPECGREIYADAERCPACGCWITDEDRMQHAVQASEPSGMKKLAAVIALILVLLGVIGFVLSSVGAL